MNKTEIRRLIDVDTFQSEIQRMVDHYDCTYIDALEEYARINDLTLEFVASIVKTHKGKMKTSLTDQCRQLNMVIE